MLELTAACIYVYTSTKSGMCVQFLILTMAAHTLAVKNELDGVGGRVTH